MLFYATQLGYADVLYGDTQAADASPDVPVAAGAAATGIDAHLPRPATISGVVRDDAGQPDAAACVRAVPSTAPNGLVRYARTGDDGAYTLEHLGLGPYRVEFSDCGNVTAATWYGGAATYGASTPVDVPEGAHVTGIDGVLSRGLHIAGTVRDVTGTPLPGISVAVYDGITGTYTGRGASTDANGHWSVPGVRGSVYKLEFYPGGDHPDLVSRWWPGVPAKAAALPVSLVAGVSVDLVDMVLPPGGRIVGTFVTATGQPAQGLCVSAVNPLTNQSGGTATDSLGHYAIPGLDTGAYRVFFRACADANYAPAYLGGTDDAATADLVPVVLTEDTTGVDGTVRTGGTITGTVTASDGTPLAGICVAPERSYPTLGPGISLTDAAGHYVVKALAPHTDYRLRFWDCHDTGNWIEAWNGGADDAASAPPIAARAGLAVTADAVLSRGGSFSGTVTDQFGKALYGVCVEGFDSALVGRGSGWTGQAGTYTVGGLKPGTYRASFSDCGAGLVGPVDSETFVVRAGADTPGVDVRAPVVTTPAAPVAVSVVPGDGSALLSWTPSSDTGHSALTAFEVRDGGGRLVATAEGSARSRKVAGLTNGTGYVFRVNAVNVKGSGRASRDVAVVPRTPSLLSAAAPASVVHGTATSVSGRLTNARGAIAAAPVELLTRPHGSTTAWVKVVAVTTSPTGSYRFGVRPLRSTDYAVRYAGTKVLGPVATLRAVLVAPGVSATVVRRTVVTGVTPATGGGRAVLQVRGADGGWTSIAGAALSAYGRAGLLAPAPGTYRVVVVRPGWGTGTSAPVRVT